MTFSSHSKSIQRTFSISRGQSGHLFLILLIFNGHISIYVYLCRHSRMQVEVNVSAVLFRFLYFCVHLWLLVCLHVYLPVSRRLHISLQFCWHVVYNFLYSFVLTIILARIHTFIYACICLFTGLFYINTNEKLNLS